MIKMFVGMIIGAVMTIYAAGGAEIADLIIQNALAMAQPTDGADGSQAVMLGLSISTVALVSMLRAKKRTRCSRISRYAYLLR